MFAAKQFQSTLPRRERHKVTLLLCHPLNFNPRSREGSDSCMVISTTYQILFQSTLPRRERPDPAAKRREAGHISIHAPAKGATQLKMRLDRYRRISIHAPAKGATTAYKTGWLQLDISIHAPAKGATVLILSGSHLHLNFNPRSREGSDDVLVDYKDEYKNFNPRSREGSDGAYRPYKRRNGRFQSTLPRRERLEWWRGL